MTKLLSLFGLSCLLATLILSKACGRKKQNSPVFVPVPEPTQTYEPVPSFPEPPTGNDEDGDDDENNCEGDNDNDDSNSDFDDYVGSYGDWNTTWFSEMAIQNVEKNSGQVILKDGKDDSANDCDD